MSEPQWNEAAVTSEQANDLAADGISELLHQVYPGDVPLKFLIMVEVLDGNTGKRSMVSFQPNDARPWDTLAMMEWLKLYTFRSAS